MRRTALLWIVIISAFVFVGLVQAARRPYYGGSLRIEMRAQVHTLDPAQPVSNASEFAARSFLDRLIYTPGNAAIDAAPADSTVAFGDSTAAFKVARWESGKSATLVANDACPEGRPFLDSIEIQMGRSLSDQALDFSLGKADVTETGERHGRLNGTLAVVFENDHASAALREALSLAIDRATINNVLLKGQAEANNALLPEWLSGYAFLFDQPRDVVRARQLASSATPISFAYDHEDAIIRRIAERIAVNAMEVGIVLRPASGANADARLELLPVIANDEITSLAGLAALLKLPFSASAKPYDAERALLDGYRVIPVVHMADAWAVSARVHDWPDLPNVWITPPNTP